MISGYMTIKEASEKWGLSIRYINTMCHNGKITGAVQFGRAWAIPTGMEKPDKSLKNIKGVTKF